MSDQLNIITSFGPQSLSLPFKQLKELIENLTSKWTKEKFFKFTNKLLTNYAKAFKKVKPNYNPTII